MRPVLLSCLALMLLASPASAAPIRVTFDLSDQAGFDRNEPQSFSVLLPEEPGWLHYTLNSRHVGAPPYPEVRPVSSEFRLRLSFDRLLEGPVASHAPSIVYDVKLDGTINTQYEGDMSSEGSWVPSELTRVSDWGSNPDISPELVAYFMEEADFYGLVGGGIESDLYAAFTLPPIPTEYQAEPVPEPATLAAWGAVGLGALAIRRRRHSSTRLRS